jgi:hypothetical protein
MHQDVKVLLLSRLSLTDEQAIEIAAVVLRSDPQLVPGSVHQLGVLQG